jgi:hypothetical protein
MSLLRRGRPKPRLRSGKLGEVAADVVAEDLRGAR